LEIRKVKSGGWKIMNEPIFALSIKQPWAWLICKGFKDIENRDWFIGRKVASGAVNFRIQLPQIIYVHAGKKVDSESWCHIEDYPENYGLDREEFAQSDFYQKQQNIIDGCGAIIGEVTITGCVTESKSPWFTGKYGFTLTDPVLYSKPVLCKGQLGFFKPDIHGANK
jgi:hypothetical protein